MAALAGELRRGLALVRLVVWIGAVGEQQLNEVAAVSNCCGEDGREAACLRSVRRSAVFKQKPDRLKIFAKGQSCMEWLVLLRIAAEGSDRGAGLEERGHGSRCSESGCEVQGRPSIAGIGLGEFRIGFEQCAQVRLIAERGGFEYVERNSFGVEPFEKEVAHQRLAAIDGPEERRHSLRITGSGETWISLNGVGQVRCSSGLNHFENGCAHGMKYNAAGASLMMLNAVGAGKHGGS